jgi:hypothetical protein
VLKGDSRDDDQSGEISQQRVFWLYRCYALVLLRRYRAACERHIEQLDQAAVMRAMKAWQASA